MIRFAREAWPFVLPIWLLAGLLVLLRQPLWGLAAAVVGLLVLLFFRDPRTARGGRDEEVTAPAWGLVTRIDTVEDAELGPGRFHRVVTFLSVFDVHVQRCPVGGEVLATSLRPGKKVAAFRADAAEVNEGVLSVLQRPGGDRVGVRQIAGLLARRVVCHLRPGQQVERGEPMGLIKFGSRVDLLVPESYTVAVAERQRVRGGETVMARRGGAG
jgi:phosphatidylserine decarboxylase